MNNMKLMWDFPVREGVSFQNANRVHPLMQLRVERLIHGMSRDENIRRMVLFGSALQFRCGSNSDLDIYIEKQDPERKLPYLPDMDCEIDIVTNLSFDSKLYQEIERTGLVLFERE